MSAEYGPMLDALRGIRWPARRAVAAAATGAHRSRQRGTSGEFTEYRLYRQGDDPRALDWKLLGRSDRAFVRLSDDRALLPTWIVLDGSASMDFPVGGGMSKWQMACTMAVGLAAVAHASGDPVGVLATHADGLFRLSPRTRRGTVRDIAGALQALQPGGTGGLALAMPHVPVTARGVLLSDWLGDHDVTMKHAAVLASGGAMLECVHLVAPEELALPDGTYRAQDPEDASIWRVTSAAVREGYAAEFGAFRSQVRTAWRALGAGYTEVTTTADGARAVRAVVAGLAVS